MSGTRDNLQRESAVKARGGLRPEYDLSQLRGGVRGKYYRQAKAGTNLTAAGSDPRIQRVRITRDQLVAELADGRVVSVPLAWSWRLSEATPAQRANFRLIGAGQGIHWPDVDEDLSVEGLLQGTPARRPGARRRSA